MSTPEESRSRPKIIRDVLIFQAKLWLEGFKDIALMPLSGGAAVIDFIFGSSTLYAVMRLGDRFERWVQLYAAVEEEPVDTIPHGNLRTLDNLLNDAADGIEEQAPNGSASDPDAQSSSA